MSKSPQDPTPEPSGADSAYELYRRGISLLERGDYDAATVPLSRVAALEPEKSSVREALGRAYFRARRYREAVAEFEAVIERYPVNDFAHFCLGRALALSGRSDRARRHLAIAANLQPGRRDYRVYRERLAGS
jgi:Flp pilus assembly protein TadD